MNAIIQSNFYKLTRFLFGRSAKYTLLLCGAVIVLVPAFIRAEVDINTCVYPFETLVTMAKIHTLLVTMLFACATMLYGSTMADNYQNGGIYSLMMLPVKRRNILLSYCVAALVSLLMICAAFLTGLLIAYPIAQSACSYYAALDAPTSAMFPEDLLPMVPFSVKRTNGLFLASIRSDVLRILIPQSFVECAMTVLQLLNLAVASASAALCLQWKAAVFLWLLEGALFVSTMWQRFLPAEGYFWTSANLQAGLVNWTLLLAAALVILLIFSIMRMNRDAHLG